MLFFLKRTVYYAFKYIKFARIHHRFRNYTMVPKATYLLNLHLIDIFRGLEGSVVECGTWRGGMIAGVAKALGNRREYYLYDSFEGLPPAKDVDGDAAKAWQRDGDSPYYHDNCKANESEAQEAMLSAGADQFYIIKGWFHETLSNYDTSKEIAILRLDGDWYDSTMECLNKLFPCVKKGGIIIVDDYYMWDGCAKAIHDYLSQNNCVERVHQFYNNVCYLIKQ